MEKLIPDILLKDSDILVVSKPAGMIVNNADTSREVFTLQDFVRENYPIDEKNSDNDFTKRGGIVHRLDKETSGVIVVALNEDSFVNLQKQFKDRMVKKTYTALCHGKLVSEGVINVPIGRLPWNRMRFGVLPQGREALTKFKVVSYKSFRNGKNREILSLVEVFPETGRTHQIRVHFQYAGFPIFADSLYAGRKTFANDKKYLKRHFLHASKLSFFHPKNNKKITIKSPLAEELENFLKSLPDLTP